MVRVPLMPPIYRWVRIPPIVRSGSSIGRAGGPLAAWFWVRIPVGTLASILDARGPTPAQVCLVCHLKDCESVGRVAPGKHGNSLQGVLYLYLPRGLRRVSP